MLWRLYLQKVFRLSFREPTTRGIGWMNLVGFMLGACAILLVTSTMRGFYTAVQKAVSFYAGDISALSYHPVSDSALQKIHAQLIDRYGEDQVLVFKTASVVIHAQGQQHVGFLEVFPGVSRQHPPHVSMCLQHSGTTPQVILGTPMRERLRVSEGDMVTLFVALSTGIQKQYAQVCAFTDVGYYDYDQHLIWMNMSPWKDVAMGFGAKLWFPTYDLMTLTKEQEILRSAFDHRFYWFTWFERNQNLFEAIAIEEALVLWVIVFIVLVASFNLISHLYVHYNQRKEAFQLLYVLGERKRRMVLLTLLQGGSVGVLGSVLGVVCARLLVATFQGPLAIPIPVAVYNLSTLPMIWEWQTAMWVVGISAILATLASIIPALRTRQMFGIAILR